MNSCTAAICTPACVQRPAQPVGAARQLARILGVLIAISGGAVFIAVLAVLPGYRRQVRASWAAHRVSRWVIRACGVRLVVRGAPRSGPSLVVGNHISWLDVLALSASAPMRMVAGVEMARWPVFGSVARRTGTLFLHRERLRELPEVVADIAAALRSGSRIQVFPEGTTRCGGSLGQFRRAAFQAAIDAAVVVSPVTVSYAAQSGRTLTQAFFGGETLVESVRRVLAMPRTTVTISWLPPIPAVAGTGRAPVDRAAVARLAARAVARSLGIPELDSAPRTTAAIGVVAAGHPRATADDPRPVHTVAGLPADAAYLGRG